MRCWLLRIDPRHYRPRTHWVAHCHHMFGRRGSSILCLFCPLPSPPCSTLPPQVCSLFDGTAVAREPAATYNDESSREISAQISVVAAPNGTCELVSCTVCKPSSCAESRPCSGVGNGTELAVSKQFRSHGSLYCSPSTAKISLSLRQTMGLPSTTLLRLESRMHVDMPCKMIKMRC